MKKKKRKKSIDFISINDKKPLKKKTNITTCFVSFKFFSFVPGEHEVYILLKNCCFAIDGLLFGPTKKKKGNYLEFYNVVSKKIMLYQNVSLYNQVNAHFVAALNCKCIF